MSLELIFCIGIISFLTIYFAFNLDKEHFLLRLACIFFFFGFLLLMGKAGLDANTNCEVVVANQTITGNITSFDYNYTCFPNTTKTALFNYELLVWFLRIFVTYIFIYVLYAAFKFIRQAVSK